MKCPHCLHEIHPATAHTILSTYQSPIMIEGENKGHPLGLNSLVHTCPKCNGVTIEITFYYKDSTTVFERIQAYPRTGPFPPAPKEVPSTIALDYSEANEVLPISAKASAALSRRCLQAILSSHGYTARDLMRQVEAVLAEPDTTKALPPSLRENIDAIRNFGNFSAHPITDQTTFQIIDVEEGEAEWCLQLLLDMFDHYYVAPAKAAARRSQLAAKLAAAGKPPMKP